VHVYFHACLFSCMQTIDCDSTKTVFICKFAKGIWMHLTQRMVLKLWIN